MQKYDGKFFFRKKFEIRIEFPNSQQRNQTVEIYGVAFAKLLLLEHNILKVLRNRARNCCAWNSRTPFQGKKNAISQGGGVYRKSL